MKKIRTGDQVVVITGRDKGKKGTVSAMLGDKILVDGVNQYKKMSNQIQQLVLLVV